MDLDLFLEIIRVCNCAIRRDFADPGTESPPKRYPFLIGLQCEDDEFACFGDFKCLPGRKRCDGTADCSDSLDEQHCDQWG